MAYELKTNTVVDALNEIHASLAGESAGKEADTVLEALNNVSVDLGGSVHTLAPDAIRDIGEHMSSGGGDTGITDTVTITIKNIGYDSNPYGSYVDLVTVLAIADYGTNHKMHLDTGICATISEDPDSPSESDVSIPKGAWVVFHAERSVYNANDVRVKVIGDGVLIAGKKNTYDDVFWLTPSESISLFVPDTHDSTNPVLLIAGSSTEDVHNYTE